MNSLLIALLHVHGPDIIHQDANSSHFMYKRDVKGFLIDIGLAEVSD